METEQRMKRLRIWGFVGVEEVWSSTEAISAEPMNGLVDGPQITAILEFLKESQN